MTAAQKDTLRREARKHRAKMSADASQFEAGRDMFLREFADLSGKVVAGYAARGREFDVWPVLEALAEQSIQTALPVCKPGSKILTFFPWMEGEPLTNGEYNVAVPEKQDDPAQPDIVLVPLLAFDRQGYRLGQGGGYYDATLAELRTQKEIIAVGVGYAEQATLFPLPREKHDQRLDMVITPQDVMRFE